MKAKRGMKRPGGVGSRRRAALLLGFCLLGTTPAWGMDGSREKELVRLVREECGSCHGLTLKGGLGPSLLPDALKEKPDEFLMLTILQGRLGTPMPPWAPFMTEPEASWIVSRLKSGFPEK
jgi:cytochrome c55X